MFVSANLLRQVRPPHISEARIIVESQQPRVLEIPNGVAWTATYYMRHRYRVAGSVGALAKLMPLVQTS